MSPQSEQGVFHVPDPNLPVTRNEPPPIKAPKQSNMD